MKRLWIIFVFLFGLADFLSAESATQVKLTPKRRCSPVFGVNANFDFYSTKKAVEYVANFKTSEICNYTYTEHYQEPVYHEITKYLCFYLCPYISFCVNLY